MRIIKDYIRRRKLKRRKQNKSNLLAEIRWWKNADNENSGILRRRLFDLPGVTRVDTFPFGAWSQGCEVTMHDGWTATSCEYGLGYKNIVGCAVRVIQRLKADR